MNKKELQQLIDNNFELELEDRMMVKTGLCFHLPSHMISRPVQNCYTKNWTNKTYVVLRSVTINPDGEIIIGEEEFERHIKDVDYCRWTVGGKKREALRKNHVGELKNELLYESAWSPNPDDFVSEYDYAQAARKALGRACEDKAQQLGMISNRGDMVALGWFDDERYSAEEPCVRISFRLTLDQVKRLIEEVN